MKWQRVVLEVSQDLAEGISDALLFAGALSVSVEDAEAGAPSELPLFGEPGGVPGFWGRCTLVALFSVDASVEPVIQEIYSSIDARAPSFRIDFLEDVDWVRQNRDQFQPIQVSKKIWVVPTWHDEPDATAINIRLDPGAAFGTGSHPTTSLCLRWLEHVLDGRNSPNVLDYGTGSGILAIASIKLGAAAAVGVDIDESAVETARFNARLNEVTPVFLTAEQPLDIEADITVANILANPLKIMAPILARHTRLQGQLALAGLLDEQVEELVCIYHPWFDLKPWKDQEGWTCLSGIRRDT